MILTSLNSKQKKRFEISKIDIYNLCKTQTLLNHFINVL